MMPHYILKLNEWYFEWSTIVDAPISYRMTLEGLHDWIRFEYGEQGIRGLPARLERVEEHGTSAIPPQSAEDLIMFNRAGEKESNLSKELIIEQYAGEGETESP